ncbi:DUF6152 family protein [Rivibacter subsaxonicus]|uniref:Uncharacterized protein n=1 Tax=Rivibacter subsaxonicus TaxID=457575 RepID=A0A4Q7VD10_9BURK|nr:DUF6152 family protein [Rivibacter subsaxonicus]RZT93777.1 hypothetical protein EV670_3331 [Rivibacter subsaxonicus]
MNICRRTFLTGSLALLAPGLSRAHHGWSGFDTAKPLYLEGRIAVVNWANPHATLEVEPRPGLVLPADLAARPLPAQQSAVDGAAILGKARLPAKSAPRWTIELAPLSRLDAWQVKAPKVGDAVSLVGYAAPGEQGAPVIRVEFLFLDGKAYGLRSSPA